MAVYVTWAQEHNGQDHKGKSQMVSKFRWLHTQEAHSFLFGSVTVLSSGLNSFQLQIPSLLKGGGKESIASTIYGVQEGLFTLLTKSTVVTPWHPKNVPGPWQHPDWEITLQENSAQAEQCLGQ